MSRMATIVKFAIILFTVFGLGCAGSRKNDPGVLMRSQRVQAAMVDIASSLERYRAEKGFFPEGMAALRDAHYLSIMPDLEREWTFKYFTDGDKITMVEATSTETMLDGKGYKITYRVPDNAWEGYGITVWP